MQKMLVTGFECHSKMGWLDKKEKTEDNGSHS